MLYYFILFVGVQIKISAKIYEFQNEMKSLDTQEIIVSTSKISPDTLNTNMLMLVRATSMNTNIRQYTSILKRRY